MRYLVVLLLLACEPITATECEEIKLEGVLESIEGRFYINDIEIIIPDGVKIKPIVGYQTLSVMKCGNYHELIIK